MGAWSLPDVSPQAVPPAVCTEGGGVHPRGDHRNAKQGKGAPSQGLQQPGSNIGGVTPAPVTGETVKYVLGFPTRTHSK